ncbi:MAG: ABC transporter permease [Thermoanaerobaculia bacterium]|nr:ABC transporter permease [Thermoanaerobaculia bacterium]
MFRNYLKIAFRHLWGNKTFSFLNLAGLATGIACAALILLWVENELSYNRFHANGDRIYQILNNQTYDGKTYTFAATPGPLRDALVEEIPEMEYVSRTDWGDENLVTYGDKNFYEESQSVEPDFFRIFSFRLLKGKPETVFQDLHSVVVTESFAKKYFGDEEPLGKVINLDKKTDFKVTGVVADPPENSSIRFTFLKPFDLFLKNNEWTQNWGTNGLQAFLTLRPGADVARVNHALDSIVVRHKEGASSRLFLFALRDWRLRSDFKEGKMAGGRIEYVRLFSVIAAFILLIACINFMNLATARSEQRAREVGVRKVLGAERGALVWQFLGESLLLSLMAVVMAAAMVTLALPGFNELVGEELSLRLNDPVHLGGLLGVGLLAGLLAGSYPSLYLSSFQPVRVLKGMVFSFRGGGGGSVRKALVVSQFVISSVLIIGTLVIYQQIQHVKSRRLGYDKENMMVIPLRGNLNEHFPAIKQSLLATGAVENAAKANQSLLQLGNNTGDFSWPGKDPGSEVLVTTEWVSQEYIATMGMKIKAGRDFNPDVISDTSSLLINETFAQLIGGGENLVGSQVRMNESEYRVIGIVEDFLFNDMYGKPDPVAFFCQPSSTNRLFVRLKSGQDMSGAVAAVADVIKKHNPGYPFEYKFMDQQFDRLFRGETLIGMLARLFAGLAVFISCLGLFGLAAYTAERRTKEIGIRKVLGASVAGIVGLLSADFLKLVGIALLIATPLAYFLLDQWLADFAYRIDISWQVFAMAGLLATVLAFLTVSFQSVKAALMNPVRSLKSE